MANRLRTKSANRFDDKSSATYAAIDRTCAIGTSESRRPTSARIAGTGVSGSPAVRTTTFISQSVHDHRRMSKSSAGAASRFTVCA
jgi:hypothetical protein